MSFSLVRKLSAALALAVLVQPSALAQSDRILRFIVPFPAGGGGDVIARSMQVALGAELGRKVIVENKAGAGGIIGTAQAAKAEPDGNTIVLGIGSTFGTAPAYYEKLPYDVKHDFTPISLIGTMPLILTVRSDLPAQSARDVVKLAKAKPGTVTFASLGDGSAHRLAAEFLQLETQTKMLHVPYKGTGPALIDLVGGQVDTMFVDFSSSSALVRSGKLRLVGVAGPRRVPDQPGVPTLAEQGVPVEALAWFAVYAPKGLPAGETTRLNKAFAKVIRSADFKKRFAELGGIAEASTSDELRAFTDTQVAKWRMVIERAGIARDSSSF